MTHSQTKVIFLDIGGILLTNGWGHESRQKAAEVFGFDYGEMNELHNFIFNVFEIGSITLDEYLDTVVFDRPRSFSKDEFKRFMFEQSQELPQMLSWMKSWKKETDLPVFALSNESLELNKYRIDKFALHQVFDGFFSSCYLGFRKPDPRIFKTALKITSVNPEESIYFDDRPMLVNAAKKLGINAIQHKNFEETTAVLKNFINKNQCHG